MKSSNGRFRSKNSVQAIIRDWLQWSSPVLNCICHLPSSNEWAWRQESVANSRSFVGLAAISGSAVNQPFRTDDGEHGLCPQALYFAWKVLSKAAIRHWYCTLVLWVEFISGWVCFQEFPKSYWRLLIMLT